MRPGRGLAIDRYHDSKTSTSLLSVARDGAVRYLSPSFKFSLQTLLFLTWGHLSATAFDIQAKLEIWCRLPGLN